MEIAQAADNGSLHAVQAWVRVERTPKLIVNAWAGLRWANDAAMAFFEAQSAIRITAGRLTFANETNHDCFVGLIGRAGSARASASLDCGNPHGRVVAIATRLTTGREYLAGIALHVPRATHIPVDLLHLAFGLTKTECELIGHLFDGLVAEEAAKAMQITVATARTHIRNLYGKLGVSSREAMFGRLLPYLDGL